MSHVCTERAFLNVYYKQRWKTNRSKRSLVGQLFCIRQYFRLSSCESPGQAFIYTTSRVILSTNIDVTGQNKLARFCPAAARANTSAAMQDSCPQTERDRPMDLGLDRDHNIAENMTDFEQEMQIFAKSLLDRGLVDPPLDKDEWVEAKDLHIDFLQLADENPILGQWLACDPNSFRQMLASQLFDSRTTSPRLNIIPQGFPSFPISSVAGAITGQLATICGTVVAIETPSSEVFSRLEKRQMIHTFHFPQGNFSYEYLHWETFFTSVIWRAAGDLQGSFLQELPLREIQRSLFNDWGNTRAGSLPVLQLLQIPWGGYGCKKHDANQVKFPSHEQSYNFWCATTSTCCGFALSLHACLEREFPTYIYFFLEGYTCRWSSSYILMFLCIQFGHFCDSQPPQRA